MGAPAVGAHGVDEQEEDFKYYVAELFVTNTLTGPVAVSALGRVGNMWKGQTHIHRDLMRQLMKYRACPKPYWCLVPFSQQTERNIWMT